MKAVVFAGPTITRDEGSALLDAEWRPPAAQGDVYRAAREGFDAIGIIDGYFEVVPSVWHKEVLWAMSRGARVYGSASMGALRAAELADFGMVGVGEVFERFRDGTFEDDDEVAVVHAPAEEGYRAISEAMVNIRATLRAAGQAGVISEAIRDALERKAKALFYPDRQLALIAREEPALRAWLAGARVDLKRLDARAMLARVRDDLAGGEAPEPARYLFEHTDAWEAMVRAAAKT